MAQQVHVDDDDFEIVDDTSLLTVPFEFESLEIESASSLKMDHFMQEPVKNETQILNETKYIMPTNISHFPLRYGSAADIPYEKNFDLKSIQTRQPIVPPNDIMSLLKDIKTSSNSPLSKDINEFLLNATHDRENLIQIAKKCQQDFINAMQLD